jgi:membrane protein YdbS with pleckstrin-like domain
MVWAVARLDYVFPCQRSSQFYVRAAQGPIQRSLGLASIHLDAAGRHTRATLRDRAAPEAVYVLEQLPGWCAAARGTRPGPS